LIDHNYFVPTEAEIVERLKVHDLNVSLTDWLLARQTEDIRLFSQLGFGLNPLGWRSKIRVRGATTDCLRVDQAIEHIKGEDGTTFQNKSGNLALLGNGKYILVERDGLELTPTLERLMSLTPSWATPNGWTWVVREPFSEELASKFPSDLFDKMQRDIAYVLAPFSLSCPFDNHNHLNSHYCFKNSCKCSIFSTEGPHHFRKFKEPRCTCEGIFNRHFCNFSNTVCPEPRYRLWFNRRLSIISFKTFAQIVLGEEK
jgi:hypothetical protein